MIYHAHIKLPLAKLRHHHHHFKPGASHTGAQSGHEQVPLMLYWQPGKRSFVEALRRKECSHKPLLQSFSSCLCLLIQCRSSQGLPPKDSSGCQGTTSPRCYQLYPCHVKEHLPTHAYDGSSFYGLSQDFEFLFLEGHLA